MIGLEDNKYFDGFKCYFGTDNKHCEDRICFLYRHVVFFEEMPSGVFKERDHVTREIS